METLLDRYIKEVSHCLTMNRQKEKRMLSMVRSELEEELAGQQIDSFDILVNLLGTPAHMAEELESTEPYQVRTNTSQKTKRRFWAIIIALLLVAGTFIVSSVYLWAHEPAYYTVTLEEESIG